MGASTMRTIKPTGKRRIVSLDEAMRRVEGYTLPVKQSEISPMAKVERNPTPEDKCVYHHLKLEESVSPLKGSYYDESLDSLQRNGWDRHLRPGEFLDMIASDMHSPWREGRLKNILTNLTKNDFWLSMSIIRSEDQMCFCKDPEGIYHNGREYEINRDIGASKIIVTKKIYPARDDGWINLVDLPDNLLNFMFGDPQEDLLDWIKRGDSMIRVPTKYGIWPIAHCFGDTFSFYCPVNRSGIGSYGVKVRWENEDN